MKRILTLTLFILFVLPAISQVSPPSPETRVAGRFVASNYGQWSLPIYSFPAGTGSLTFTLSSSTVRLPDGRFIMPFNTNAPIRVGSETVTPSAVGAGCILNSTTIGGCSITATFSNAHSTSDQVLSATFGLQEALNDAGNSGGGAVTIDSAWTNAGGTTGIKNAATLPSNTGIEDARTGIPGGGGGPPTGAAGGDLSGTYPNPGVAKVNGSAVPTSKTVVGTDSSGHIIDASSAALANNTSGTAGNLSGTPALPNGTTATTQSAHDNSTKLATTAYADAVGGSGPSLAVSVATGAAASPAAPYVLAASTGTVSHCYFTTLTADASVNLVFNVKFNGTNILSGTSATITAGDTPGTIHTVSLTSGTIAITQGQKWELDITTGAADWTGAVQCY